MAEPIPLHPHEGANALVHAEPFDVESRAVALARSGAPLRRALAAIAGRLVAVRAWERLGFARLRDYGAERAGVSGRQLQELARVDGALAGLPRIESAFLTGRLSWTQVRLLARVARAEDEADWIDQASQLTARALAREVRRVDARSLEAGGVSPTRAVEGGNDGEEERVGIRLRLERSASGRWGRARMVASRLAGRRLSPWEALELVTAEVLSTIPLAGAEAFEEPEPATPEIEHEGDRSARRADAESSSSSTPANGCTPQGGRESPHPAALQVGPAPRAPFLASLLEGLEVADPFELDARLRRALRLEQQLLARLGPLLLEVVRGRLYRRYGFASFAQFASEWLGLGERKAQALLRLERACHACPALRTAWRAGQLSWVRAHVLVPLLLLEEAEPHREAWVARARRVSVRRLEDEVDRALAMGRLAPPALDPGEPQTGARPMVPGRPAPFWISAPRDVAWLFRATLAFVQRRLERLRGAPVSESEAFEAMCGHACETWRRGPGPLPKEQRIYARDGWRCAVPGCSSQANLHAHHVIFRSAGGSDAPSNLITLCAWHHQRGVHSGLVRIQGQALARLRFELGLRRGTRPLASYRSGDRVA